jgi:hypothetical protein
MAETSLLKAASTGNLPQIIETLREVGHRVRASELDGPERAAVAALIRLELQQVARALRV